MKEITAGEAKKIIRATQIYSWGDIMYVLEYLNGKCPWSEAELKTTRLLAADQIDSLTAKAMGALLDVFNCHMGKLEAGYKGAVPILPSKNNWCHLRNLALPPKNWQEERNRRRWDDTEGRHDAVCSERMLNMNGFGIKERFDFMKDMAVHCHITLGFRNFVYFTDKDSLPGILNLLRMDENRVLKEKENEEYKDIIFSHYLSLQKLIISPITEEVGLVFCHDGSPTEYCTTVIGEYQGERLKSVIETKLSRTAFEEKARDIALDSIISSMAEGTVTAKLTPSKRIMAVEGQYYYLDWRRAGVAVRSFPGNPAMKKSVFVHSLPKKALYNLTVCESPAIILDTKRLTALGFVTKNGEKFLIPDGLMAFKIEEQEKKDGVDVFTRYKEVVDRLNSSLASICSEISSKVTRLPGMQKHLSEENLMRIIDISLSSQPAKRKKTEDTTPCLEPVQDANLKPYLDAMIRNGYLEEEAEKNRYRRTRRITEEALVLFAYLLNDKIAKAYESVPDKEKKVLKRWYNEKAWCGNKPGEPGKGFDALEEWRHLSDKKIFRSMEEGGGETSVIVNGTRTMRARFFSNLLSIPERKIIKDKSVAIESESEEKEFVDSFEIVWTKGKRAKVLNVVFQVDKELHGSPNDAR